jgi:hypothetical protein
MYEGTPRSSTLTRVSRTIEALARALFARSDRNAGTRGWDVTVTGRWRTSRVYHDPRYDRLATCTGCAGRGCSRCAGTGRITAAGGDAEQRPSPLRPPAVPARGRGELVRPARADLARAPAPDRPGADHAGRERPMGRGRRAG